MTLIRFSDWVPDSADLGNPGATSIKNAVPGVNSYKPFPSLAIVSTALDARPRGAISIRDRDNNFHQYVGDAAKLYRIVSSTWTDSSKVGGYATGSAERWEFIAWDDQVIATNFSDNMQFLALGGTTFADLHTTFKARHIAVVRDHVIAANTYDATDGNVSDRVRMSAFNDATDWTVSSTTGSDSRDLKTGGWIQRVVGGEVGVIVSERSTFRLSWVGAPTWWQIDEVLPGTGTIAPGSVVKLGDIVYFISESGFVALVSASGVAYPGAGKVDQFIRDDLDENYLDRVSSAADTKSGRVAWAYPGAGNTSGRPNKIIIYDRTLDKWALIEQDVELIWRSGGLSQTLDDLTTTSIDDIPGSLDSSDWIGGAPQFSAFDSNFKHGAFSGTPMDALLETAEVEFFEGHRGQLTGFRPLVDGGTVTGQVGYRNRQSDGVTWDSAVSPATSGRCGSRRNARFHRFRVSITNDEWTDAIGVEVARNDIRRAGTR